MGGKMFGNNKPEKLASNRNKSPIVIYNTVSIVALCLLLGCFLLSRGELISKYFFHDTLDTGMDFFHSIEYTHGRKPYEWFGTLYPPLANLFFFAICILIPGFVREDWGYNFLDSFALRGTVDDLRLEQACLLAYCIFIVVCTVLLFALVDYALHEYGQGISKWCATSMVLSYGSLYAIERGNIILLCSGLCLVFVLFYRSKNRFLREVAIISLAIAAGLKIYPALLGLMLITEKNWKLAIRCVIYGIAAVILPLFVFEGLPALGIWIGVMTNFNTTPSMNWNGTSLDRIINNFFLFLSETLDVSIPEITFAGISVLACFLLCVCTLVLKKRWQSCVSAVLPMVALQSQADYSLCIFLVPLVVFFCEEKCLTRENIIPFLAMTALTVNIPVFYELNISYPRNTITQIALISLIIYCYFEATKSLVNLFRQKNNG